MTSIEWLIEKIQSFGIDTKFINKSIEISKEMHKQEIIDAYNKSFELRDKPYSTAHKYYQETFVSKGSDDVELPQQEISDEEIEAAAERIYDDNLFDFNKYRTGFINCGKWYREQLEKLNK
jgi:vacuolar-type H+-ATPase subunit H